MTPDEIKTQRERIELVEGDGPLKGHLWFYSKDWAAIVRFTEGGGWQRYNRTESKWERIGEPSIRWGLDNVTK